MVLKRPPGRRHGHLHKSRVIGHQPDVRLNANTALEGAPVPRAEKRRGECDRNTVKCNAQWRVRGASTRNTLVLIGPPPETRAARESREPPVPDATAMNKSRRNSEQYCQCSLAGSDRNAQFSKPFSRCLAMTMRCTSLVPSPISQIFASRMYRSTG